MTAQPPREITCDAGALAADAVAVSALARLRLGAKRQGSEIKLRGATTELRELLAFCGLEGVLADADGRRPRSPPQA